MLLSNLGKDASLLRTLLNLEEYHFTQWATKVGLIGPKPNLNPRLNKTLAVDLMRQLEILLGTDKIKERYKLELIVDRPNQVHVAKGISDDATSALGVLSKVVSDEMRGDILARAKLIHSKNSLPKRLWWAAVDKAKFEDLVRDVRAIVQGLWALLDPIQQDEVMSKIQQVLSVVIEVSKDVKGLKDLQTALKSSREDDIARDNVSLAAAAGLKAARVEIHDEGFQSASAAFPGTERAPNAQEVARLRREILLKPLSRTQLTDFVPKASGASIGIGSYAGEPVLVEYKSVIPKLKAKLKTRVGNLAVLLSTPKDSSFLTLHCLGFFEDGDQFAFVFKYPTNLTGPSGTTTAPQIISLHDVLRDPAMQPSVTARLGLIVNLCSTLLALHTAGWLHKDIRSENILFFLTAQRNAGSDSRSTFPSTRLSKPYLAGFAFSRVDSPTEISEQPCADPLRDIYRHPNALGDPSTSCEKLMDRYSLGTVMIEIAEWRPLKTVVRKCVDVTKEGVDVPLSAIAGFGPWLMREKAKS